MNLRMAFSLVLSFYHLNSFKPYILSYRLSWLMPLSLPVYFPWWAARRLKDSAIS
jgi:hypothetical protein